MTAVQDVFHLISPWADELNDGHLLRERAGEFSSEKWKTIQRSGILSVPFDEQYGGLGHSLSETMTALRGLGYHSRDAGLNFSASTQIVSVGIPLQRFAGAELKEKYLPRIVSGETITAHAITEPGNGSDAMNIGTTAERSGAGHLINGGKMFITNAPVADVILLYARTGEPGPFGLSCFVLERETPGLTVGPALDKMGLRTSPLSEVTLENVTVGPDQLLGQEGAGFLILDYVMKREILLSFSITVGEMQYRLERCVDRARKRHQFGTHIGSFQAVSHKIADMKISVETARKWLHDTASKVEAGADAAIDIAATKTVVSEANVRTALDAVQIFGGEGYLTDTGIEQDVRNAVGSTIYSGTSEIQRNRIASLLGL